MSKSPVRNQNVGSLRAISLPTAEAGSSLRDALAKMKRARQSGLVVNTGGEISVVSAAAVAAKAGMRGMTLKDIVGVPVHIFDVTPIAQSTPEPFLSSDALVSALKRSRRKIGLLAAPTAKSKNAILFSLGLTPEFFKEPGPSRPKKTTTRKALESSE